jgi:hypothetical protein
MKQPTRKLLLLPAIAVALLSGCVSYGYRGGHGDYYYGQPTTEYSYPYGYGGYGYGDYGYGYGYPGYYSAPYWGGSIGYYGYYGPRRPPRHDGGHGNDHGHGHGGGDHGGNDGGNNHPPQNPPDRPRPPWRDLGRLDRQERQDQPVQRAPMRPSPTQAAERAPQPLRSAPRRVEGVDGAAPIRRPGGGKRDGRLNPLP